MQASTLITPRLAEEAINSRLTCLPIESLPLTQCVGGTLRENIYAERDAPPYDRVYMDGIAVDSEQLRRGLRRFQIQATQAAGSPALKLASGENAIEVMTGSVLPVAADCVIPVEQYDVADGVVSLKSAVAATPYHNVHRRGSDSRQGALLLKSGTLLRAPEIAARHPVTYDVRTRGRDVRDLANVSGLRELPRLLRLAASRAMGLLNFADLSRDAAMPQTTLQRYWALFEATFLVRSLPPWHANLGLRLVKTPKVLLGDTGLLCHLLGLDAARLQGDDLMTGAALECFVAGELTKQVSWSETRPGLFHYRTHTQHEVDFVLEDGRGRLVGIEVKKTASPASSDFKGLRHLAEQTGKRFLRGILLYTGASSVAFESNLHAVPVSGLWQLEAELAQS